jgi:hypothetical protein
MQTRSRQIVSGLLALVACMSSGCAATGPHTKGNGMSKQDEVRWLLGTIQRKSTTLSEKLRHDPKEFLRKDTSPQAALSRQVWQTDALPSDDKVLETLAAELLAHIETKEEPSNGAFQRGYAELMLRQYPTLQKATTLLIEKQWHSKQKIGHYELFSALVMEYSEEEPMRKTLAEIHGNLKTWNNKGWCPWTPGLWLRILWLGEHLSDSSKDITAQLQYIDSHMGEDGKFQDRQPFCLMYCIGMMDHPLGDKMLDRFLRVIIDKQQSDGGWGEYSYIVFTLLKKWDLMETLAP